MGEYISRVFPQSSNIDALAWQQGLANNGGHTFKAWNIDQQHVEEPSSRKLIHIPSFIIRCPEYELGVFELITTTHRRNHLSDPLSSDRNKLSFFFFFLRERGNYLCLYQPVRKG